MEEMTSFFIIETVAEFFSLLVPTLPLRVHVELPMVGGAPLLFAFFTRFDCSTGVIRYFYLRPRAALLWRPLLIHMGKSATVSVTFSFLEIVTNRLRFLLVGPLSIGPLMAIGPTHLFALAYFRFDAF